MSHWLGIAVMVLGGTTLAAQQFPTTGTSTGTTTPQGPPRTGVRSYAESVSRDLFTGCDADSDDRLDLFEACEALDSLPDPRNSAAFRRLDTDRDGFLSWPEFDHHFWSVVQVGGTFHVRPARPLVDRSAERQEARPATPLQRFLRMHDANGNGTLEATEVEQMVQRTDLPPDIAGRLRGLDHDQSSGIDEAELTPWFELLRGLVPEAVPTPTQRGGALLPPWHENDADGNGRIDLEELSSVLRRLDPTLVRWAGQLLAALDLNKDGQLDAEELPLTKRPVRTTASVALLAPEQPATAAATPSVK